MRYKFKYTIRLPLFFGAHRIVHPKGHCLASRGFAEGRRFLYVLNTNDSLMAFNLQLLILMFLIHFKRNTPLDTQRRWHHSSFVIRLRIYEFGLWLRYHDRNYLSRRNDVDLAIELRDILWNYNINLPHVKVSFLS